MLKDLLVEWMVEHPLSLFQSETLLVQSNGIGQWLKFALAEDRAKGGAGIAANIDLSLPSMFIWRAYRAVLGEEAVPKTSPYDKSRLTWRLFRLLAELPKESVFTPLEEFLEGDHAGQKRWQLAERLSDLYDQYQIYRGDWLESWGQGEDRVCDSQGLPLNLAESDCWQAALWRLIGDDLGEQKMLARSDMHRQFLAACKRGAVDKSKLPARLIVFGVSALPQQILEALHALSDHIQILLCIHNPCRFYWADIIDGRELFNSERRRHANKGGIPENLTPELSHQFAPPLLAAWGKQGRDFIRLLDRFDESHQFKSQFGLNRIDLFDDSYGEETLLNQIQRSIRDLEPLTDSKIALDPSDESLRFTQAYSAQREVEILQNELLDQLAKDSTLSPRDILVMVPDVDSYRAEIESAFGWMDKSDPRFIPFSISDQSVKAHNALLNGIEQVLSINESRVGVTHLLQLIELPAVQLRFGFDVSEVATLAQWIRDAGVRWGLDSAHRSLQGMPEGLEQNSWLFGLKRMLLGYAVGESDSWGDIAPLSSVQGVSANAVGGLSKLVRILSSWSERAAKPLQVDAWLTAIEGLLTALFDPQSVEDELLLDQIQRSLAELVQQAKEAAVVEAVPLKVVSELLLANIDPPNLNRRFMAGGITFATLMPMRAIPFRRIYLLGMQDGAYPRAQVRNDFDLMARPDLFRPGDRSRRDDDRYLFLEAMLSARDHLGISWVGRSAVDNSERPASVLVAQLRDYIDAQWQHPEGDLLKQLTTTHPLQPFSRRYFESDSTLFSYAKEWRASYDLLPPDKVVESPYQQESQLSLDALSDFFKAPARDYFKTRIGATLLRPRDIPDEFEPFEHNALDKHRHLDHLLEKAADIEPEFLEQEIDRFIEQLSLSGQFSWGGFAERQKRLLKSNVIATLRHRDWVLAEQAWQRLDSEQLVLTLSNSSLSAEVTNLYQAQENYLALFLTPSAVITKGGPRADRMLTLWPKHLFISAVKGSVSSRLAGPDGVIELSPVSQSAAIKHLSEMMQWRLANLNGPLALAARTAIKLLESDLAGAKTEYEGEREGNELERISELEALWPTFADLLVNGFESHAQALYAPMLESVNLWREGQR
jgi:exodeoxyribonuclease V gamma subunit